MALKIKKHTINVYNQLLKVYHGDISISDESDLALTRQMLSQHFDLSIIDSIDEFYVRIDRQVWDKSVNSIIVNYYTIDNDICKEVISSMIASYIHIANPDVNLLTQAYNYLKTLPEFEGAIDC